MNTDTLGKSFGSALQDNLVSWRDAARKSRSKGESASKKEGASQTDSSEKKNGLNDSNLSAPEDPTAPKPDAPSEKPTGDDEKKDEASAKDGSGSSFGTFLFDVAVDTVVHWLVHFIEGEPGVTPEQRKSREMVGNLARIRTSVRSADTREDLVGALNEVEKCKEKLKKSTLAGNEPRDVQQALSTCEQTLLKRLSKLMEDNKIAIEPSSSLSQGAVITAADALAIFEAIKKTPHWDVEKRILRSIPTDVADLRKDFAAVQGPELDKKAKTVFRVLKEGKGGALRSEMFENRPGTKRSAS